MTGCCSTSSCSLESTPKRHVCPNNGKEYLGVPQSTVLQHIKKPWKNNLSDQAYYFCSDTDCDVVYFGEDDSTILSAEMRTVVGIKDPQNEMALSCYCFDVTHAEAQDHPAIKQFVVEKTKSGACSCESQNPSGRCCLKDFPKKV